LTRLYGKGFRSAQNKQATLAQKMELAKKQQDQESTDDDDSVPNESKSSHETKSSSPARKQQDDDKDTKENDEFAKLLAQNLPRQQPTSNTGAGSLSSEIHTRLTQAAKKRNQKFNAGTTPTNTSKKKKKKSKSKAGQTESNAQGIVTDLATVIQVGDRARRHDFDALVDPAIEQALGPVNAAQLVPWVPPFVTDYLVVLADPRRQSNELRQAVDYLQSTEAFQLQQQQQSTSSSSSLGTSARFLAVLADNSPKEVLGWKERAHIAHGFSTFLDSPSLDWMTTYGCVNTLTDSGELSSTTWSLHLLIFDNDGTLRYHMDSVNPSKVCQLLTDALETLSA